MHRRNGRLIVSPTDLVGFLACGHLTHLERAAAAGLIHKPDRSEDPEVALLQRRGGEHEKRYIDQLEAEGRRITRLDTDRSDGEERRSYEERAAETELAMRRGDDVIYQATVFDGRWVGHPDFLLRVDGHSDLGDWHYEVADTKLAHTAKASALVQICSYVEQIERIQARSPERVIVVTGGAQIVSHPVRTAEMMAYYRRAKQSFERALDEAVVGEPVYPIPREQSYPDPVEHCGVCRWFPGYCRQAWRTDDALPLVAGISRTQRSTLAQNSVITMRALSELDRPIAFDGLKAGQAESLWRMREQAALQIKSAGRDVPEYELLAPDTDEQGGIVPDRGLSALPAPSEGDLFFDIEGDPFAFWEGLDYLFGVHEPGGGLGLESNWHAFWALNRREEKQAFERVMDLFMDRWRREPQMHIYHYAPYEPTALKRLAGRHATRENDLDQLLRARVFVDLYRVIRQGVRVGTERYSIKNLEPLYGYRREVRLRDANSSIVEFEKVLEIGDPDGALRDQIEAYNKDDCLSTERLRDWLEDRRRQTEREKAISLPRPTGGNPEPGEELSDRIRAVRELSSRLTADIPGDPARQTDDDKATWLLAHLLDWHRREDKSAWWRYYDLLSKTDEELLEEPEPIAGLAYRGIAEGGGTNQSHDHRYSFPPQEHKIEAGIDVDDPGLPGDKKRTGKVQSIDDEARVIVIRRRKAWQGPHPTAIVQKNIIDAKAQREALMRLGEWVAEHGISSPLPGYRAARDLLRRHPPRRFGGQAGELAGDDEPGSTAARRLGPLLDATTLPIQGPPGSGKTYTGARMILDLVRAGRRVGITSNSHKVIGNLLRAVCNAAQEDRYPLRAMQRGDADEVISHGFVEVKRADDNSDVVDGLTAGDIQVAAGTPWLWARPDMEAVVDTLFVDEAGQVSLANVVAVAGAARNVVLLGDPQQLDQPTQGVHPDGAGRSALAHLLNGLDVVPRDRGLFLEKTWRMHPVITSYTSRLFYEGELQWIDGLDRQRIMGHEALSGSGLRWLPVAHHGNTNSSPEEADAVVEITGRLLGRTWVDADGQDVAVAPDHVVIMSPFNAHRLLIEERLRRAGLRGVPVGTVDKFQGQEAPVSIYTMATSRPEDAPRGLAFLYSLNRLNVATSRARALTIVVCSPALLAAVPKSPEQLRMVNALCAFVESAAPIVRSAEPIGTG